MKIAYVLNWDISQDSGLLSKIANQIQKWEELGHDVSLCVVSYKTNLKYMPKSISKFYIFERPDLNILRFSKAKTFFGRNWAISRLTRFLIKENFHIIYYRQNSTWYPALMKMVRRFPVVMEVNTNDRKEIRLQKGRIKKLLYYYGQHKFNKLVSGIVAVTHEISNLYSPYNKKTAVIPNGTFIKDHFLKKKEERPQLLFIGSPNQLWQGEEKVVYMASKIAFADFHIIGFDNVNNINLPNCFFYGYLQRDKVSELYSKMDIGIGTLSLYKKNMQEACPLKVREYLSYQLPVILGYIDSDVHGYDFTLFIGNYEKNVEDNIDKISDFIRKYSRVQIEKDILEETVGIHKKEIKRMQFLSDIFQGGR